MVEHRSSSVVALFPGQGGFDGVALATAAARHQEVRAVFEELDEVSLAETGRAVSAVVLAGEPPTLAGLLADEPWVSQLAIYGTAVAVHRVLRERGLRPVVLMGHSLGEIAALVAAGVYTVAEGAKIVFARVHALRGLDLRGGYMAAVSADARKTRLLVDVVEHEHLAVAVENHDRQTVVSGPADAMDTLGRTAKALGVSFARLDSPAPFHGPLMRAAADALTSAIRGIPARRPEVAVYSPILDRAYTEGDDMPSLLASHLVAPVKFGAAVRAVHAGGARYFVECGARATLSKSVSATLDGSAHTTVACLPDGDAGLEPALGTLRAAGLLADGPAPAEDEFDAFWSVHGPKIINRVRQELANQHGSGLFADLPAGAVVAEDAPPRIGHDEVAGQLRELYAEALEYPVEVFTDEVELEAELGIDSVKQIELLTRVSEEYGLQLQGSGFRLTEYDTMGKVIGHTVRRLADRESADV
ncbi:acyltransferase domain-containing protein [Amycolatopsis minnesotensis]|uniref:Acyltransferase domain-containing protein n=1 Tax=Amycolatopsis minnesotensis TaxID=337894 RepID=A0ABP5BB82_9PSEU